MSKNKTSKKHKNKIQTYSDALFINVHKIKFSLQLNYFMQGVLTYLRVECFYKPLNTRANT